MKKLLLTVGAFALAFTPLAVSTPAFAEPGKGEATGIVNYCKEIISSFPGHSLGECIAFFRSDPSAFAAHWCLYFEREGLLDDFGYDNMGDCISTLNGL